jgi:hypothetical protein
LETAQVGQGNGQPARSSVAGRYPLLERGEVEAPVIPDDEFAVEHRVGGELTDRVDDLSEVPTEGPLLARLQRHPTPAAEGYAAAS